MGALFAPGLVTSQVLELYDYKELRSLSEPTMFVVRLGEPTLVLGASQSIELLNREKLDSVVLRRRRGGGGLVLLQPDDLWIDWWIPANDPRWSRDVHVSSLQAGGWWRDVLAQWVTGDVTMHEGSLEGDPRHRVVCFAGRGPGEIFVDARKAVGLAQWRVREGIFVTTVLHAGPTDAVVAMLSDPPPGLHEALDHHDTSSLALRDPEELIKALRHAGGPWIERQLFLTA